MNKTEQNTGLNAPSQNIPKTADIQNPLDEKIQYLEARIRDLSAICQEIDPYQTISDELKMKLLNFNILDLSDPFKITNQLLVLLEDTIDELHLIKPFNDEDSPIKEIL
jgi:hypothetical protein